LVDDAQDRAAGRARAREEAILDAAATVFARHGFHRATIAAVAREGGVADGTIYNYFADKRDLLAALMARLGDAEGAKLELGKRADVGFDDLVRAYVDQRFAIMWSERDLLRAVLPELLSDPSLRRRYFADVVAPAQARGTAAVNAAAAAGQLRVEPQHMVRVITGAALGVIVLGLLGDDALEEDLAACARATTDLVLHGVAAR